MIISAVFFFLVIHLKTILLFKLERKSPRIKLSEGSLLSAREVITQMTLNVILVEAASSLI